LPEETVTETTEEAVVLVGLEMLAMAIAMVEIDDREDNIDEVCRTLLLASIGS
jgi:hypothetical protein